MEEYAALLEVSGATSYATRAFRRAATLIRGTLADVTALVRERRVRSLRGIGEGIERRLYELVDTWRIAELEAMRREVSLELAAFGRMHGFRAGQFVGIGAALGIRTVRELREAAARGRLLEVHGIGPRTEAAILGAPHRPPRRRPPGAVVNTRRLDQLGGPAQRCDRRSRPAVQMRCRRARCAASLVAALDRPP